MPTSPRLLAATAAALVVGGTAARAQSAATPTTSATSPARPSPSVGEVVVTARRLSDIRSGIQTQVGASTYSIDRSAIAVQPGGLEAGLNQIVLQAPGVAQDSFGQLHIRGEHGNLQYRLNGVILPEGLSAFGQTLNARLAERVSLITGALPAEYGLRTAGIVDIATRSGAYKNGGSFSLYGGSQQRFQSNLEYAGSAGPWNGFASVDYETSGLGIESPDGRSTPLHDVTHQGRGFAYAERVLDQDSKVTFIAGFNRASFQIPDVVGGRPGLGLSVNGRSDYRSEDLRERQREITGFGVISYLRTAGKFDLQASAFARYSSLYFQPDRLGDLLFTGLAQEAFKTDTAAGVQLEGVYHASEAHTLRAGLLIQGSRARSQTTSDVLPVNAAGVQTSNRPLTLVERGGLLGLSYSGYLQDEWRLTQALVLNYGLRYDRVDAQDKGDQLSPRVNAVWKPLRGLTVHAGYARYFTPAPFELVGGSTVALFANTTAAAPGTRNDPPRAERADYFDVGASQRIGPRLTVGIDTYYKRVRNLLDEGQFGAPIIQTPFNYDRGVLEGVEFTADYRRGALSAYANLAISRARGKAIVSSQFNFDPADLAYIAAHAIPLDHDQTFTASAGAAYKLGQTTLSGDLIFGSGLRADGATPNGRALPAYVQVNAAVSHAFQLPRLGSLEARLDVINLLDAVYVLRDGTGVGVGAPQYGPRRGLFVGLTKTF